MLLSSVRFSSVSFSGGVPIPCSASKECQTVPVCFSSSGTDPIRSPEKYTQTETQQKNGTMANGQIQIRTDLVDLILEELDRAQKEEKLLATFERKMAFGEEKEGRRVQLRHICQFEIPEIAQSDHSIVLSSVHCGPGNRIALLFGFPQHEIWCSGHLGARLVIIDTRRSQRGQISSIPMSTCPSSAEFARHGELVIVGTHSGELLLLSAACGDVLWSSESTSALTHSFTVTQLRWMLNNDGTEQQRELISLSLDGIIRKSRLEADNRLESLQSVNFTLAHLPRELRKGTTDGGGNLGLIGCVFVDEAKLLVATETGIVLKLDMDGLALEDTFVLGDSTEALEQFGLFRLGHSSPMDEWRLFDQIIWRTSDGVIRCCPFRQQKPVTKETKMLALPQSRENFQICSDHRLLLILGARALLAWDILKGVKITLLMGQGGAAESESVLEGISANGDFVVVVKVREEERSIRRELALFELASIGGGQ